MPTTPSDAGTHWNPKDDSSRMTAMSRIRWVVLLSLVAASAPPVGAQHAQNATLRHALAAYDNLDIPRALALARPPLAQRVGGDDPARPWALRGLASRGSG